MFICKFCQKQYITNSGGAIHQKQCKMNPNQVSFQKGRIAWNKGLTKADPRIASIAMNVSQTLQGRKPNNWNPDRESLRQYRSDCAFKFSVYDYPNEFDLSLLEEYGWYKAKNNGDNPGGISRDHLVSVKYGFDNGISPSLISHPANCKLMKHRDNVKKYSKNSISIEELTEKIKVWNKKYLGF